MHDPLRLPAERIIPVLDLQGGLAVHARAGRRSEYRPLRSRLTESSQPVEAARAFRDRLGLRRLYLADLDAIAGREPAWNVYSEILELGIELLLDAGIRSEADAERLTGCAVSSIIAGLETLSGPALLKPLLDRLSPTRLIFSLDLRAGQPLGARAAWDDADPLSIAARAAAAGARRFLVLDLARVGLNDGPGTVKLCRAIRELAPDIELLAGGGIRDPADARALFAAGVDSVLIASALHDGRVRVASYSARH